MGERFLVQSAERDQVVVNDEDRMDRHVPTMKKMIVPYGALQRRNLFRLPKGRSAILADRSKAKPGATGEMEVDMPK